MSDLPKRTADTMSDAISISSPNGRVSKRRKEAAVERLRQALFGDGLQPATVPQPSEKEALLRQAAELRALAAYGVKPRAHTKRAKELELLAAQSIVGTVPAEESDEDFARQIEETT